jgi:hypothetical protein
MTTTVLLKLKFGKEWAPRAELKPHKSAIPNTFYNFLLALAYTHWSCLQNPFQILVQDFRTNNEK